MGDKGKKDKGKREQQKKAQRNPKEKRKLKKEKKKEIRSAVFSFTKIIFCFHFVLPYCSLSFQGP